MAIVALGLFTQRDLNLLGGAFELVWGVDDAPRFTDLLEAIDEADRAFVLERDEVKLASRRIAPRPDSRD